jgi:hypothetical protein
MALLSFISTFLYLDHEQKLAILPRHSEVTM